MQDTKVKTIQKEFEQKSAHLPKENYEEILQELDCCTKNIEYIEESILNEPRSLTKIERLWIQLAKPDIKEALIKGSKKITLYVPFKDHTGRDFSIPEKIEITEAVYSLWEKINKYFEVNENLEYSNETFTLTEKQAYRWLEMETHHNSANTLTLY